MMNALCWLLGFSLSGPRPCGDPGGFGFIGAGLNCLLHLDSGFSSPHLGSLLLRPVGFACRGLPRCLLLICHCRLSNLHCLYRTGGRSGCCPVEDTG